MSEPPESWNGPCSKCGAVAWGTWPHPEGEPCSLVLEDHEREQIRRDEANASYIEMLNAQRDYWTRSQMPMLDMGETFRTATEMLKRAEDE